MHACMHVELIALQVVFCTYLKKAIVTHLGSAWVDVREVDGAGVEVDESHGNALSLQGGEVVEVDPAELEPVDQGLRFGAAEGEGEVLGIEHGDLLLNEENSRAGT